MSITLPYGTPLPNDFVGFFGVFAPASYSHPPQHYALAAGCEGAAGDEWDHQNSRKAEGSKELDGPEARHCFALCHGGGTMSPSWRPAPYLGAAAASFPCCRLLGRFLPDSAGPSGSALLLWHESKCQLFKVLFNQTAKAGKCGMSARAARPLSSASGNHSVAPPKQLHAEPIRL
jgi:hypothetical protein